MRVKAIYLIIALFLTGCTIVGKGVCRHDAIYAAMVAEDKYPSLIAWGMGSIDLKRHAQAQALIGGKWEWLCINWPEVYVCEKDRHLRPLRYFTLQEYIEFEMRRRNK